MNIIIPTKVVKYEYHGPKTVEIPKFGLLQYRMVGDMTDGEKALTLLIDSIKKNASKAERDLISLHILEFNDKMSASVTKDGFEYNLDDVYISQKLKFEMGEYLFKFRSPSADECVMPIDLLLKSCCTLAKRNGEKIDVPDFMEMPAFVLQWADKILNTISIDGPDGPIEGLGQIMELFDVKLA